MSNSGRTQITIQIYPDRHPNLYKYCVGDDGKLIKDHKPSQKIPSLAENFLAEQENSETEVLETLARIEDLIKSLKVVGVIDDKEANNMRDKARKLKAKVPVSR